MTQRSPVFNEIDQNIKASSEQMKYQNPRYLYLVSEMRVAVPFGWK